MNETHAAAGTDRFYYLMEAAIRELRIVPANRTETLDGECAEYEPFPNPLFQRHLAIHVDQGNSDIVVRFVKGGGVGLLHCKELMRITLRWNEEKARCEYLVNGETRSHKWVRYNILSGPFFDEDWWWQH